MRILSAKDVTKIYITNICAPTASLLFQVVCKMKSLNYLSITIYEFYVLWYNRCIDNGEG